MGKDVFNLSVPSLRRRGRRMGRTEGMRVRRGGEKGKKEGRGKGGSRGRREGTFKDQVTLPGSLAFQFPS